MGTRHLTIVYMDCAYRVAQYGQWDGYPEGAGVTILKFLRNTLDEQKFRQRLLNSEFLVPESQAYKSIEGAIRLDVCFPEFDRDTGPDILRMIQEGETTTRFLADSITFAAESLFCEWAYVIDFDKRTFEVYEGFNKTPLTEDDRFYFLRNHETIDSEYHCVKLVTSWPLDELPTEEEFLTALNDILRDEEDDE